MPFAFGPFELLFVLLLWLGIPVGLLYLGWRAVRAFERRNVGKQQQVELSERMLRIEERLEAIATDVERSLEGRRFDERLLRERGERAEPR